ncbi:MAG: chemotaxis response regulator protein-glutamate methylesterase [Candidatus Bathyarchaeia archaeon]|jgi:two-component system chemotaxis response regulator CheB
MRQIKLLIVDDSLFMQKILSDLLQSDEQILVVGTARDGEEALSKIGILRPDVVTMDIEMPRMDGLTAVKRIMETDPVPVVIISALTQSEARLTLKALEYGAVDFVSKPSGKVSLNMEVVRDQIISKIKYAAFANITSTRTKVHQPLSASNKSCDRIISIASSTGGPPALTQILKSLPADIPPILIVQHMPKGMTKIFAEGLSEKCKFDVKEAEEGDKIQENLALVAPGGFHMVVTKEKRIGLTVGPPVNYVRPSADVTMISMAERYGFKNIGVVLTGIGIDGAKGIKSIKEKGGFTIAQDEETSVVFGMPKAATQTGCVDLVAPLGLIPKEILKACN